MVIPMLVSRIYLDVTPDGKMDNGAVSGICKATPEEPEYRALHRIADATSPVMAKLAGRTVLDRVEAAIARGDLWSTESVIPWSEFPAELGGIGDAIRGGIDVAGQASVRFLPTRVRAQLRFDLLNPQAVEYIRQHTGGLTRTPKQGWKFYFMPPPGRIQSLRKSAQPKSADSNPCMPGSTPMRLWTW